MKIKVAQKLMISMEAHRLESSLRHRATERHAHEEAIHFPRNTFEAARVHVVINSVRLLPL
jgi:hypothetical protein